MKKIKLSFLIKTALKKSKQMMFRSNEQNLKRPLPW